MGFVLKGSQESLAGGVGSACLLALFTYVSYQYYLKRQKCIPAVILSLGIQGRRVLCRRVLCKEITFAGNPLLHTFGVIAPLPLALPCSCFSCPGLCHGGQVHKETTDTHWDCRGRQVGSLGGMTQNLLS